MFYFGDDCKIKVIESNINGTEVKYKGKKFTLHLVGLHQIDNLKTALTAIEVLRDSHFYDITADDIANGIEKAKNPARFELISNSPMIILDGGHNEASVAALSQTVRKYLSDRKVTLLLSFMKDKDYETCLRLLSPVCENAVFTCVDKVRGENGEVLAEKAELIFKNVYFDNSVDAAYEKALSLLKDDGVLIVAGSFYLASYVRSLFENLR